MASCCDALCRWGSISQCRLLTTHLVVQLSDHCRAFDAAGGGQQVRVVRGVEDERCNDATAVARPRLQRCSNAQVVVHTQIVLEPHLRGQEPS